MCFDQICEDLIAIQSRRLETILTKGNLFQSFSLSGNDLKRIDKFSVLSRYICTHSQRDQNPPMPDTFMTRPLSRSTSILKVRDRLNMLMGHSLHDDEDEYICFEAPAARTLFHTHEDCLIYKYLLYRDRYKSKVHVLYFKWWLWFEDEKGGRMEELIETAGQLEIKMKDIHRTLQTAANEGKVLSTAIMRT